MLLDDAVALVPIIPGRRALLGLVGAPAAGKSTLARRLVTGVNERVGADTAAYVPMDGFHLSNAQLDRLGRRDRKGAPDTFDVDGYVHLLRRLRAERERPLYAPDFDRRLDELWYVDTPSELRENRLLRRHVRGGRTESEARDFIAASERPNAHRIELSRAHCTRIVVPSPPSALDD